MTDEPTLAAPGAAPKRQVFVRMYRALDDTDWKDKSYKGLLGDCFLVRVVEDEKTVGSILIDCGILMGSQEAAQRMQDIVADVRDVTGDRLDLLVVTHEHWDHISGFSHAQDLFFGAGSLSIDRLWLAWTENDGDQTTRSLKAQMGRSAQALAGLADRMRKAPGSGERAFAASPAMTLNGLEAFLGPLDNPAVAATSQGLAAAAQSKLKSAQILSLLKDKVGREGTEYLVPGEVRDAPGGMRAFVLGPPRNLERLFKDRPSSGVNQETYLVSPAFERLMFEVADGGEPDPSKDCPFAPRYQRIRASAIAPPADSAWGSSETMSAPAASAAPDPLSDWFRTRYFDDKDAAGQDQTRRRVDADWLGAASPLAMRLDSDTNNTSLVLAFELPDETIMLFPGDAQVGNWLSWHDQDYVTGDTSISAADLLKRVRFYKVGHHGSHNATLDEKGLNLMTHPELVAAIPTDEDLGKRQGTKGWEMPNPRVKRALLARTAGRVIRNDRQHDEGQWGNDPDTAEYPLPADFFARLRPENLYLEYRVFGPP